MVLRRKLSDVGADNALLTQNFLMVKARLSEVKPPCNHHVTAM